MTRHLGFLATLLALPALALPALAQPKTVLPPAKDGRLANLVSVPAADARWVALSETHKLLAFCHERTYQDANLSLVRLDAKGNPAAYAIPWKLPPRPGSLAKLPGYALSAAFHPKLPVLYVWQDIAVPYGQPVANPPDTQLMDHLLVYNVAKEPPELVVSLCRGPEYVYGQSAGALAVDAAGEYLYVPNLHEAKNTGWFHFGRFKLDADGLPAPDDKDAKQPAAVRVKNLTALNVSKGISPNQVTPVEYVYLFGFNTTGYGTSFHPLERDVVLAGTWPGLMIWRPGDKVAALHHLPLKGYGDTRLALHPKMPLVYAVPLNATADSVFLAGHADGYLTLLPRQYVFADARLSSPPAVVDQGRKLAVGGHYHVYVVGLDERGRPRGPVTRVRVLNPQVRALVYSPAFERLYVGVEVSK